MGCRPVLSNANGPVPCDIMLIGEAPGRFGAGKTGVPFSGDVTGRRLGAFVAAAGLAKEMVFMTNAVLCLPLNGAGNNRRPTKAEIANCTKWLAETLDAVRPKLVVAMGEVALGSTRLIERHALNLQAAGKAPVDWRGIKLAVTYHPGARSQVHRPWERQVEDWRAIGSFVRALEGVHSRA